MRKFPTYTQLFIDFEAIFWWREDGKAFFQTDSQNSLKSRPSVTFLSAAIASRWESEHLHVSCLRKKDSVPFHFEKKQAHPSRGWLHLHETRCPCHFPSFLSAATFEKNPEVFVTFLIHCMGNFEIKILRFLFIVKTNHWKMGTGDVKCKTPQ